MISFIQIESYKSHNTSQFIYYDTKTNLIQINKNLRKGKCYTSLIILSILLLKISLILLASFFHRLFSSSLAFFFLIFFLIMKPFFMLTWSCLCYTSSRHPNFCSLSSSQLLCKEWQTIQNSLLHASLLGLQLGQVGLVNG